MNFLFAHYWIERERVTVSSSSRLVLMCPAERSGSERDMKAQSADFSPLTSATWPRPAAVVLLTEESKGCCAVSIGHGEDLRGHLEHRHIREVTAPCWAQLSCPQVDHSHQHPWKRNPTLYGLNIEFTDDISLNYFNGYEHVLFSMSPVSKVTFSH